MTSIRVRWRGCMCWRAERTTFGLVPLAHALKHGQVSGLGGLDVSTRHETKF
jgi:hypothetical protein